MTFTKRCKQGKTGTKISRDLLTKLSPESQVRLTEPGLEYVKGETKDYITTLLADPAVHDFTKKVIREGLTKDCVDAVCDIHLAVQALEMVRDDALDGEHFIKVLADRTAKYKKDVAEVS